MFIVYDIIFLIFAMACLPYLILKGKWHAGLWTRFGSGLIKDSGEKRTIWVHAVSVGEVLVVLNLVQKIRQKFPRYNIVLSTVTATGHALASRELQGQSQVIYAPLDFSWVVRKYIAVLNPVLYISAETEIWPNLFTCLHARNVPIVEVNGRISDQAFAGYRKVSFLTRRVLRDVRLLCMQSREDARRIIRLGADAKKVRVAGNLKFDNLAKGPAIRKDALGFSGEDRVFIAGSTYPGEEEIMVEAYRSLKAEFPRLRLVIAPRRVERADEIARLCGREGLTSRRFSDNSGKRMVDARQVLIVDQIGYLRDLYALADVVFVGKSLRGRGGQNMIEPLAFGKPTLVGPHTENFRDVVRIFMSGGALIEVRTPQALVWQLRDLLKDPQRCVTIGQAAQTEIAKHQGATETTVKAIEEILGP
ncbi:MAG TPA: 3-deoxy-D-manno-octulosonic acid transferase [Candidatus Omnitrophica bacterium]|nr:MAG: hypothetical protein A2Y05_03700 [Omnitrophica WOR_2 bacterium GWA2_53_43]HBO97414.1 3-deoxy-D-manno-octulosonic acid transferase [Candidatus Omnitrophota bacterium]HCI45434.1 3-deoxy-D-manno-octulosonic acid transferase [Candidatus Omnitrophota bacterium]